MCRCLDNTLKNATDCENGQSEIITRGRLPGCFWGFGAIKILLEYFNGGVMEVL
jgi:hypothetical protein